MRGFGRLAAHFGRDTRGATAIEYGLIAALIAVGALAGMMALGGGVGQSWNDTAERITSAMGGQ